MRNTRKITALAYHDIVDGASYEASGFQSLDANIYKLDRGEFLEHLREIARRPSTPVTVERNMAEVNGRAVLLTFDDGGESAASHTAGMLSEFGWLGHFFIPTDRIGETGFLAPAQIRELRAMGHVVGTHSCSHPSRMWRLPSAEMAKEWRDSRIRLEDVLGQKVEAGAVPGGFYSRRVGEAASEAGLRYLFTSEPVVSVEDLEGCRVIGRFSVKRGVGAGWVGEVISGSLTPRLESYAYWTAKKLLKALGGESWLALRKGILTRRDS